MADFKRPTLGGGIVAAALASAAMGVAAGAALAAEQKGLLETIHKHITLTSSVPENGDQNPYAIVVAPVSAGTIQKDDVLVDNFNGSTNLQGTGTTIIDYNPADQENLGVRRPYRASSRDAPAASGSAPR